MSERTGQDVVETLRNASAASARTGQDAAEVLRNASAAALRTGQDAAEVLRNASAPNLRAGQAAIEVLRSIEPSPPTKPIINYAEDVFSPQRLAGGMMVFTGGNPSGPIIPSIP